MLDVPFLKEWEQTFKSIAPHLSTMLKLTLMAEVKDLETAKVAVGPLSFSITPLRSIAVSFGEPRDEALVRLATETAEKHTFQPKGVFRFLDLQKSFKTVYSN